MKPINDEISCGQKKIIFKGWTEVERPPSSTIHTSKGEGLAHVLFVHDYSENGNTAGMKDIINNCPWVLDRKSMGFAMENALKAGQSSSIALLLEYVDILNVNYLQSFLLLYGGVNAKLSPNHFKALDMLRFQRPGFIEQIYTIKENVYEKIYEQVTQYLEISKIKESLEQEIPESTNTIENPKFRI